MPNTGNETFSEIMADISNELRSRGSVVSTNLATNYYTKDEINALLVGGITTQIVNELPEEGLTSVIYLVPVPADVAGVDNVYKEYIWIEPDGEEPRYEALGSTELRFSDYYTKTNVNTLLADKMPADTYIPVKTSDLTNDKGYIKLLVVNELPAEGEENTMYAVPATETWYEDNLYNEYVWINGAFEKLGWSDVITHSYLTTNYYNKTEQYSTAQLCEAMDEAIGIMDTETNTPGIVNQYED